MHGETQLVSRPKVTPRPLRPLDDYKEFGVNCEKMASEIEDHILLGGAGSPQAPSPGGGDTRGLKSGGGDRTEGGGDKDRG